MKFFESPFYRREVEDLEMLQGRVEKLHVMMHLENGLDPKDEIQLHVEFLHTLYALIEKEQCLFTRLQLDGSKEAKEVCDALTEQARETGMAPHHTLPSYHHEMKENIKLELMDLTGEDLDEPVIID